MAHADPVNWCPTCRDFCLDHPNLCTTCGTTLTLPPPPSNAGPGMQHRVQLYRMSQNIEEAAVQMRANLEELQAVIRSMGDGDEATFLEDLITNYRQRAGGQRRRTAQAYLDGLPRIEIQERDPRFNHSTVRFSNSSINAVPAEFGFLEDFQFAAPLQINDAGITLPVQFNRDTFIMYSDRGDLTFAAKAIRAQELGAKALIVGNHLSEPWPYTMQDSQNITGNVTIPIVMIRKEDVTALKQASEVELTLEHQPADCIICTETMEAGDTCLQIECQHIFHEQCVLPWLNVHNTCPYCRFELDTEDAAYNAQRRREQERSNNENDGRRDADHFYN